MPTAPRRMVGEETRDQGVGCRRGGGGGGGEDGGYDSRGVVERVQGRGSAA